MILEIGILIIAALAKAIMDAVRFHQVWAHSDFWDVSTSWKNKYKNGDANQGPRFPGSTTIFVWLTDGWHLMQMVFLTCMFALIVLHKSHFGLIIDFIIMRAIFGIIFEITFRELGRYT